MLEGLIENKGKFSTVFDGFMEWWLSTPVAKFQGKVLRWFNDLFGGLDFNSWLNRTIKGISFDFQLSSSLLQMFQGLFSGDSSMYFDGLSDYLLQFTGRLEPVFRKVLGDDFYAAFTGMLKDGRLGYTMNWWLNNSVKPWFTKEKWAGLASQGYLGIIGAFTNWKNNDWTSIIKNWFHVDVSRWFTSDIWKTVGEKGFSGIGDAFQGWKHIWRTLMETWWTGAVVPWFKGTTWGGIAGGGFKGIADAFNNFKSNWGTTLSSWWTGSVLPWFSQQTWFNAMLGAAHGIYNAFRTGLNWVIDLVNGLLARVSNIKIGSVQLSSSWQIPRLATGLDYVPFDEFPAFLHKGETVLPATQAAQLRALGGMDGVQSLFSAAEGNAIAFPGVNFQGSGAALDYDKLGAAMYSAYTAAIDDRADVFQQNPAPIQIGDETIARANRRGERLLGQQIASMA